MKLGSEEKEALSSYLKITHLLEICVRSQRWVTLDHRFISSTLWGLGTEVRVHHMTVTSHLFARA